MIVVVSAMVEELAPLAARLRTPRRVPGTRQVEGGLGDATLRLVATGAGRRRAIEGVRALIERLARGGSPIDALLLVGVAGGLDPKLRLGDVVRVGRVLRLGAASSDECEEAAGHRLSGSEPGTALTVDRIVAEAAEKEELWRSLGRPEASVVDMESFHWATTFNELCPAPRRAVLRAVSDPSECSLPSFLADCVGSDGAISRARVAAQSLRRPRSVSSLLRLRRDVRVASTRLADAVEELVVGGSVA